MPYISSKQRASVIVQKVSLPKQDKILFLKLLIWNENINAISIKYTFINPNQLFNNVPDIYRPFQKSLQVKSSS